MISFFLRLPCVLVDLISMSKQLVLMDHDGGVDDYLATMLLMTMEQYELIGVVVTPADCYIQPAVSATRKFWI